jgi:imidazole glycerol-phosphate synthase subunit HisH
MIGIIDYGLGNLNSLSNIIKHVGGQSKIITSPDQTNGIKKFILPGVGSFDHGMDGLLKGKWIKPLNKILNDESNKILGICLGMQLMCKSSEEGVLPGLGWINADVKKLTFNEKDKYKIPHMGWNDLVVNRNSYFFKKNQKYRFYFVHSYHVICNDQDNLTTYSNYGLKITSSFEKKNIFGLQFHPEKSHSFGKEVMKKYISI